MLLFYQIISYKLPCILNEILKRTPGLNDVKLVVDATETGSFQIVYNLIETVSGGEIGQLVNYLTDTEQKRYILNGILGLGAFFVKLCTAIRGDKVEKDEILDNENVELTVGERKIIATLESMIYIKIRKKQNMLLKICPLL